MDSFWHGMIIGTILLLAVTAGVWWFRINDFTIRGGKGKPARFSGRFPEIYRVAMKQFLEDEIADEKWTIRGAFKDRRFIRMRFSGNMHPFSKQRIRNFMMSLLHP